MILKSYISGRTLQYSLCCTHYWQAHLEHSKTVTTTHWEYIRIQSFFWRQSLCGCDRHDDIHEEPQHTAHIDCLQNQLVHSSSPRSALLYLCIFPFHKTHVLFTMESSFWIIMETDLLLLEEDICISDSFQWGAYIFGKIEELFLQAIENSI